MKVLRSTRPKRDLTVLLRLILKGVPAAVVAGTLLMGAANALLQLVDLERFTVVVLVEAFAPYVSALVVALFVAAALRRRWRVTALAALVASLQVPVVLPVVAGGGAMASSGAPVLRIFDQNVYNENATPERVGEALERSGADIAFLQEVRPDFARLWASNRTLDGYPYRFTGRGLAIYATRPFTPPVLLGFGENRSARIEMMLGGRQIRLYDIHMPAPLHDTVAAWQASFQAVAADAASSTVPTILAGDFNATPSHHAFRDLLRLGFVEQDDSLGGTLSRTWPVLKPWEAALGGILTIDHVLTRHVRVLTFEHGPGDGSDHSSITASLALASSP